VIAVGHVVIGDMVPDFQAQRGVLRQPQVDATSEIAGRLATALAGGEISRDADQHKRIDATAPRAATKVLGHVAGSDPSLIIAPSPMRITSLGSHA